MGIKLIISWKNKKGNSFCSGGEASKDFGLDDSLMYALGINPLYYKFGTEVNLYSWGEHIIQQFFNHQINLDKNNYKYIFINI